MPQYQYRVIPAPNRGLKAKGLKTPEARFSHALEEVMNEMAAEGWEYQRAETLPSVERAGLTSTATHWRNVLVFRKAQIEAAADRPAGPTVAEIETAPQSEITPPQIAEEPAAPGSDGRHDLAPNRDALVDAPTTATAPPKKPAENRKTDFSET